MILFQSGIYRTSVNAYKKYLNTRPVASAESNKRVKLINFNTFAPLDEFTIYLDGKMPEEKKHDLKLDLMNKMKIYRPAGVSISKNVYNNVKTLIFSFHIIQTIFELNPHQKSAQFEVMKNKRKAHRGIIAKHTEKISTLEFGKPSNDADGNDALPETDANDIESTFSKVIVSKKRESSDSLYKKNKKVKKQTRDVDHYIPYQSSDKHTEDGLAINNFERQARAAELSITASGDQETKFRPGQKKWDRLRKKMVSVENPRNGKIRTESGIWIPATYKTGRYADWKEKTKIEEQVQNEFGGETSSKFNCFS